MDIRLQDLAQILNVRDYGALGYPNDDTDAINATIAAAVAIDDTRPWSEDYPTDTFGGSPCVYGAGVFLISSTITLPVHCDFSRASFVVTGDAATTIAINIIGPSNAVIARKNMRLPELIAIDGSTPTTTIGTAIQFMNCQFCKFFTRKIERFNLGLSLTADGNGTECNEFRLGSIINCNLHVDLGYGLDGSTSWVNDNHFYDGALSTSSGVQVSGTRFIRIGRNNNNSFHNVAMEGDGPEYFIECAGRFNLWAGCRWEGHTVAPRVLWNDIVGTPFSSGCDNAICMGLTTFPLTLVTLGSYAARNVVTQALPGATAGLSHRGANEFWNADFAAGKAALMIDAANNRVGIGTSAPHGVLSILANRNIDWDDFAAIGQTFSNEGLVLGYNAKADESTTVSDRIVAMQTFPQGFRYAVLTLGGIRFHASDAAVTAGDDLSAIGLKLEIDGNGVKILSLAGLASGDKYLVVGSDGRIRVSAIGPSS